MKRVECLVPEEDLPRLHQIASSRNCKVRELLSIFLQEDCPGCTRTRWGRREKINLAITQASRAIQIGSNIVSILGLNLAEVDRIEALLSLLIHEINSLRKSIDDLKKSVR